MAKKELNLFQFAARGTAEAGVTSAKVVASKFADANLGGELLHDMPDELFRYSFAPNSTCATHPPEKAARANSCDPCPVIQKAMQRTTTLDTGIPSTSSVFLSICHSAFPQRPQVHYISRRKVHPDYSREVPVTSTGRERLHYRQQPARYPETVIVGRCALQTGLRTRNALESGHGIHLDMLSLRGGSSPLFRVTVQYSIADGNPVLQ